LSWLGVIVKISDMERQHNRFGFWVMFLLLSAGLIVSDNSRGADAISLTADEQRVALIPCKGFIDDGLFQSIKRRSNEAMAAGATYLIYEIGTYGGALKSADDISKYLILDVGKKVHTVAYITTEAISAGAMISVSCRDIIMLENTTIGDCAPIMMGGQLEGVEREKSESFTRAAFRRAAEANGYPAALLQAMVTQQLEVHKVKNKQSGEYEFFEKDFLPDDPNVYDLGDKQLVVKDDELLTLTASQAQEFGIARTQVTNLAEAIGFLSERDGVSLSSDTIELEMLWSEQMVRWLNSPVVMGILVMLAMLAVYTELHTPGLGLAGLIAVICVVVIVCSKYLVGMANWVEIVVFAVGVLLLLVEIFVIPGFGIAGMAGLICIFAGMFGMLVRNPPDKIPWPKNAFGWDEFIDGLSGFSLGFVGFLIAAWFLVKYLPKIQFLSGLMLATAAKGEKLPISMTAAPETMDSGLNVGDIGVVVSALRPAGSARFEHAVVDVVTEGEFIEDDMKVKVLEIHGNRVIVREVKQ